MKKMVIIYVRKSRLKGDDELEISRQIELLVEYCDKNNMDYVVFHEEGSSEDWNRPELQKMLKELESEKYDGVLVTEQDRITRDSTDFGLFKRFCRKEGLMFYTLNKMYDFLNDDDNFITGITAEMDTHFMRIMKRKMMRGRIQALHSGIHFGIPPYGYEKTQTKPKILIKNLDESKVVESIYDMYVNQGLNQREIAEKVNLLGKKTRDNKPFTTRSISLILSNVVYIGTIQYDLKQEELIVVKDAHESIIDKSLFNEAQILRSEKRTIPQSSKKGRYLLSQLIKCSDCGTTLTFCMKYTSREDARNLNKDNRELFVLNCHSSLSTGKKEKATNRCGNMGVKAKRVEEKVFDELEKYIAELENEIEFLLQEGDKLFSGVQLQIEEINGRLKQLASERMRVQSGFRSGIYDDEEAKTELGNIESDRIKLEATKEKLEKVDSSSEIKRIQKIKDSLISVLTEDNDDVIETNKILRDAIQHIYYYKDQPDVKKLQPFDIQIVYK